MEDRKIEAADLTVREAYNDAESLAEFGEWCALRLFGDFPEALPTEGHERLTEPTPWPGAVESEDARA